MVEPVELEACGTAAGKTITAEHVVLHALEDPGVMVVARRFALAIVVADERALAREADAAEDVGGPVGAPPQPAIFAVEGVVVLAGLGSPGADAAFGAADLDGARHMLRERDPPVEA